MSEEVLLIHALVGVVHSYVVALEVGSEGNSSAAQHARVGAAAC